MMTVGCHISFSAGWEAMGQTALSIDANTFAFFTRNPRGGKAKAMDVADAHALASLLKAHRFGPLVAHAPYTMNLASKDASIREFAREMLADDLSRLEHLPGQYYNFHPGSHVGQGMEQGIHWVAQALNATLTEDGQTTVLLEGMSGKGSEIGGRFEELAEIMRQVEHTHRLGVCLDTCHLYDAGYDIKDNLDGVLAEFDQVVGLQHLRAMHLNDSKNPFSSRKDRHEVLGKGVLGWEAMAQIINHKALCHLPFILETPNELPGYAKEIKALRRLYAA